MNDKLLIDCIQKIYDDFEINVEIFSFWDAGFIFRIGDVVNGYKKEYRSYNFKEGLEWLWKNSVIMHEKKFSKLGKKRK